MIHSILSYAAILGPALMAQAFAANPSSPTGQVCAEPARVHRKEILRAMSAHGAYSLTSTTTSMLFGAKALLAIVRQRQRQVPGSTQFLINHSDWFAAHLEAAGVPYEEMSAAARAGFEYRQDALVDYGPQVVEQALEGPAPKLSLDITIFWPDSGDAPSEFSYKDTLSVPKVDVFNQRVIRFKLLEYDDMLVFDRITGISVRPIGFLSAVFVVLGKPDLKQTRLAVSADQWQVLRGQVKVFPGISKTGTAMIEPGGLGHQDAPPDRRDLESLEAQMRRPLRVRYGEPSCQTLLRMRGRGGSRGNPLSPGSSH